jgi:hypothetical protein
MSLTEDVATMDNAAEQYDLITALWRLEGFNGIEGEIGQSLSIDEHGAATDTGRMGRMRTLFASLQCWAAQWLRQSTIA